MGVLHITAHIALRIGHRENGTQRTAALDLQGKTGPLALEGIAHHRSRRKRTAKRGRRHRQSGVNISGALSHCTRGDSDRLNKTVAADCSNQFIHILFVSFTFL